MAVSITEYEKALISLEEALVAHPLETDIPTQKMIRDSCIQRFEFCVELAWKTALKKLGLPSTAPKPAIRDLAKAGLIADVDLWFDFIEARNKSSHAYDEKVAEEVLEAARKFLPAGEELLRRIQQS